MRRWRSTWIPAGKTLLVTGADRGLGRSSTQVALAAGAAKVCAGACDRGTVIQPGVHPVRADVTSANDSIRMILARCFQAGAQRSAVSDRICRRYRSGENPICLRNIAMKAEGVP